MVGIAAAVEVGKDDEGLLPAVFGCEPTRRAREEEQADEEDGTGDSLDSPGNSKGGGALSGVLGTTVDEAGAVLDEVLDEDTPYLELDLYFIKDEVMK